MHYINMNMNAALEMTAYQTSELEDVQQWTHKLIQLGSSS